MWSTLLVLALILSVAHFIQRHVYFKEVHAACGHLVDLFHMNVVVSMSWGYFRNVNHKLEEVPYRVRWCLIEGEGWQLYFREDGSYDHAASFGKVPALVRDIFDGVK